MRLDPELGDLLYDQTILVLESIGEEVDKYPMYTSGERLGAYLDTRNTDMRVFLLEQDKFYRFIQLFGHNFYSALERYSKKERQKGTEILFELNQGNITMNDFEKRLR